MPRGLLDLHSRVALVTGAGKRIGAAISRALAEQGADLVLHYRKSEQEVRALAEEIQGMGRKTWLVRADLEKKVEVEKLWEVAQAEAGSIELLVNNASIFPSDVLRELEEGALLENVRVNALAPFYLMRLMAEAGHPGAVVNLLDTRYVDYDKNHVAYHLSKRMLFTLTRMAAQEFAPLLRVNAVAPGLVLPPEGKDQTYLDKLKETNPLQDYGTVEGIAEAALFLMRGDFITGQVIFVDGGRHMRGAFYG